MNMFTLGLAGIALLGLVITGIVWARDGTWN